MGVKDLWSVLSPVCEKKSLWEFEGKSIAIDLSSWICDSQSIRTPQANLYLRNIFFRASYLLLLGVRPVFVLEGDAPEIKADSIRKRLAARAGGKPVKESAVTQACSRKRLRQLQNQIVTGVITQDSDVFLYGAKEAYRNFQLAPHFTCDCYKSAIIEEKLGLSRSKLIGFSILAGSDYSNGVHAVGRCTILKFLATLKDNEVFQRFLEWKNGYSVDATSRSQLSSSELQLEQSIRTKALMDNDFPHLEVIAEYMGDSELSSFSYKWSKPNLAKFVALATKKLAWEEDYAVNKFIPVLARWHLLNGGVPCGISITSIVGRCRGRSTPEYKVNWEPYNVVTKEPKYLVGEAYASLVDEFEGSKKQKKNPKSTKGKSTESTDETQPQKKPSKRKALGNQLLLERFLNKQSPKRTKITTEPTIVTASNDHDTSLDMSLIIDSIIACPQSNPALHLQ